MKTSRAITTLALAVALLAGCGEASDDDTGDSGDRDSAAADKPAKKSKDCKKVSRAMLQGITEGAEDEGSFKLAEGAAYLSPDFEQVYFIAARLTGPGLGGDSVGVWASNSLKPGQGVIMAVDGFAKQFTVWPDGDKTAADISGGDPAIDKARDCLS